MGFCRYGKVFKSHIFGSQTIISIDAEVSRFVLQSDSRTFVPSYPKSLTELMGKNSILLINGSLQRRVHGLIGAFFKSPQLKAQITREMENYMDISMASWRDDRPIFIQDEAKNVSKLSPLSCSSFFCKRKKKDKKRKRRKKKKKSEWNLWKTAKNLNYYVWRNGFIIIMSLYVLF